MTPNTPRRTKIIATLGPATDRPGMLEALLREGVDIVRLNLSHGSADDQRRRAKEVRTAAENMGREVGILADLCGPKIRINEFEHGHVDLEAGQHFALDCRKDAPKGNQQRIGVAYLNLYADVQRGDTLLLDDGLISMYVDEVVGTEIRCTVIHGGVLSNRKGLNKLGGGLSIGALTDKDRKDVELAAELGVDFLAVSFARSAQDMHECRALLRKAGSGAATVAKIERAEAIQALGEIIDASDAVMVARGDLGVEIGDAELPGLQKKIIREALARNRAVITATQMLQSMVESPIPTRAEVLDVANAVIDGTDAVMLSQESAAGKHPDKAVAAMARICLGAERQFETTDDYATFKPKLERTDQAIALASMFLSSRLGVRAIVALTESGSTAQWLSRYRSAVPIYGMSRHQFARQRMALFRDVYPIDFDPHGGNSQHAAKEAILHLFKLGKLAEGDRLLFTAGDHTGQLGGTNTLKLLQVGLGGVVENLTQL
jgi:pyruvate kinase